MIALRGFFLPEPEAAGVGDIQLIAFFLIG